MAPILSPVQLEAFRERPGHWARSEAALGGLARRAVPSRSVEGGCTRIPARTRSRLWASRPKLLVCVHARSGPCAEGREMTARDSGQTPEPEWVL